MQNFTVGRVGGRKFYYLKSGQNVPKNEQTTKKSSKRPETLLNEAENERKSAASLTSTQNTIKLVLKAP